MLNNMVNEKKLKYKAEIVNINENNYISVSEYEKRGNSFFDVVFNNNGKEIFIGRYNKELKKINVKYNNGKILVFTNDFIKDKGVFITDVLSLYDVLDDTFYSVTKLEALNVFDPTIDSSYIKNKNKLIVRDDIEKYDRMVKSK